MPRPQAVGLPICALQRGCWVLGTVWQRRPALRKCDAHDAPARWAGIPNIATVDRAVERLCIIVNASALVANDWASHTHAHGASSEVT